MRENKKAGEAGAGKEVQNLVLFRRVTSYPGVPGQVFRHDITTKRPHYNARTQPAERKPRIHPSY
jgi:hypothetical protein